MNKILRFLAVILLIGIVATPVFAMNMKTVTNNFNTGASADKEYVAMEVYNTTDTTISNGQVLVWDTSADDGRSVTLANLLGMPVCGVANESIAASTWGTMLVYGYHSAVAVLGDVATGGSATAGTALYAYGSTDDAATANTTNSYNGTASNGQTCAIGNATTKPMFPFAVALDDTTTAHGVEAIVNCL